MQDHECCCAKAFKIIHQPAVSMQGTQTPNRHPRRSAARGQEPQRARSHSMPGRPSNGLPAAEPSAPAPGITERLQQVSRSVCQMMVTPMQGGVLQILLCSLHTCAQGAAGPCSEQQGRAAPC